MGGQLLRNRGMTFLGGRFLAKTWDDSFREKRLWAVQNIIKKSPCFLADLF